MVKEMRKNITKLYDVQPSYKRFNQKYNMTRQVLWNPPMINLQKIRAANLRRLVEEGKLGYTLQDFAFYMGASANFRNCGFNINRPNYRGNSWQPIEHRISRAPSQTWGGDPSEGSKLVRRVSKLFGADQIGFCELDRRWVYSHYYDEDSKKSFPIRFSDEPGYEIHNRPVQLEDGTQVIPKEMKFVVVLLYEMDAEGISQAPTLTARATTRVVYSRISATTVMIAEFLRGLGYNAIPSANCTALSIPLAIEAGLGQLGRNGKLITPEYGPRCRISKVITDMPLETGHPIDFGVTEYCTDCQICAERCPAGAIPFGHRTIDPLNECNSGHYRAWMLDGKKCYEYWATVGTNCGICVSVCPYSRCLKGEREFWKSTTCASEDLGRR